MGVIGERGGVVLPIKETAPHEVLNTELQVCNLSCCNLILSGTHVYIYNVDDFGFC